MVYSSLQTLHLGAPKTFTVSGLRQNSCFGEAAVFARLFALLDQVRIQVKEEINDG